MPQPWSPADLAALADAAEALLCPLKWPTRDAWMAECLRRIRKAFHAEASVACGSLVGPSGVLSPDLPGGVVRQLGNLVVPRDQLVHSVDTAFDDAYAGHRRSQSRILTMRDLRAFLGDRLEDSLTYQTVVEPSRLYGSASFGAMAGGYDTVVSVMTTREADMELDAAGKAAMRIARAALSAGLEMCVRLEAWRTTIGTMLDRIGTGVAVFGHDGTRQLAQNRRLDQLLAREPERARLADGIRRVARLAVSWSTIPLTSATVLKQRDRELALAGGSYQLQATGIAAGELAHEPAVLILVNRLTPELPAAEELIEQFDLTAREAEIGLLLAEGLSNSMIAQRVRLSPHTVRHYIERLFDKVGVKSRRGIALLFLTRSRRVGPR
jgi:DNA-binding CsgD family transcriptional regulator